MAIKAINYNFTESVNPIENYNSSKTNVGKLIKLKTGAKNTDKFISPINIGLARPMEQATSIACSYPHVYRMTNNIDHVFFAEIATAAATRKIVMYEFNRETSVFSWKGFITLTYPITGNHTIKGMRMIRNSYNTGTVSCSGTTLTGSSTDWVNNRLSAGSRIGFGFDDPTKITTWYKITSINSNTSITLNLTPGTLPGSTKYVIEDLMCLTATSNSVPAQGGLFVTKGLTVDDFVSIGTTIPAATNTDNIKAVYWLADAGTVTNTTACGVAIDAYLDGGNQECFILDINNKIYRYNFRAPLTLSSGKSTNGIFAVTNAQASLGVISQTNNGRLGTLNHGSGSGIKSLYYVTTTRVYRVDIDNIYTGNTNWQSDVMVEIPPGGISTYPVTSGMACIEIANDLDMLIITSNGIAGARSYVTKYNTVSDQFDHIFLTDDKQYDQSVADSGAVAHPAIIALPMSPWSEDGLLYLARSSTSVLTNSIYTIPIGAHWKYAINNQQMLITKSFDISNSSKLYNASFRAVQSLGTDTFALTTEPFRTYYRTSGISDNSGTWVLLDESGDLSGVSASEIQFGITFRVLGTTCLTARLLGLSITYEDKGNDSHYIPSIALSSIADLSFTYRQDELFPGNIPDMRIKLYNADTNSLILDDTTNAMITYGVFEYSTNDGVSWATFDATKNQIGNYIRYTATSLPGATKIKAILTQN